MGEGGRVTHWKVLSELRQHCTQLITSQSCKTWPIVKILCVNSTCNQNGHFWQSKWVTLATLADFPPQKTEDFHCMCERFRGATTVHGSSSRLPAAQSLVGSRPAGQAVCGWQGSARNCMRAVKEGERHAYSTGGADTYGPETPNA